MNSVKDTVIVISRRVSYADDSCTQLIELKPLKAIELPSIEVNLTSLTLPKQNTDSLPTFNSYVCNDESEIMPTITLPDFYVKAYPMDSLFHDMSIIAYVIFIAWYISGSLNRWKTLYSELRKCIFVS